MALIELKFDPPRRELRNFALIWFPAFLAVVGGIVAHRTGNWTAAAVIWGLAVPSIALALTAPRAMRWIYVGLSVLVFPIGFVLSHLLFAVFYFTVVTPIGLLMRAVGRDPMRRTFDRDAASYWQEHEPTRDVKRYFKQF